MDNQTKKILELQYEVRRLHARLYRISQANQALTRENNKLRLNKPTTIQYKDDLHDVVEAVVSVLGVSWHNIIKRTRKREIVIARHFVAALAKKHTNRSLKRIGNFIGGYDHSTVIHAVRTVQDLVDTDKRMKHDWDACDMAYKQIRERKQEVVA